MRRSKPDRLTQLALGAAGGFVGTVALTAVLQATMKWMPQTAPPLREEPGKFMVHKAEDALPANVRASIPRPLENAAARLLAIGYGITFGALYAALRPRGGSALLDGAMLGIGSWAAGYLGWLPALGLMPPVWRQKAPAVITPAAEHVLYGVATVGVYDWLRRRAS